MSNKTQTGRARLFAPGLLMMGSCLALLLLSVMPSCISAAPEGVNLALKKPAVASSSFTTQTPNLALDGAVTESSKWASAPGAQPPHTLTVDLGLERMVSGYVVRHAGDAGESKTYNTQQFSIQSANLLSGPWVTIAAIDNTAQDNLSLIEANPPKSMRFVRLLITDPGVDSFARIPEFEIYGPEMPSDGLMVGLNSNSPIDPNSGNINYNSDPSVMADTGTQYARVNFILGPWSAPDDPTPHGSEHLTWYETYDRILNGYIEQGVQIYGLIGAEAVRLPAGVDERAYLQTPEYTELYTANWLKILGRYRDRVKAVESFNEPNNWAGGSSAILPPDAFARLLARLYLATKVENGHAQDSSWTGLTLVTGPIFTHNFDNGASFWQDTIHAGRANHGWNEIKATHGMYPYDGIGVHYYMYEGSETPSQTVNAIRGSANAMAIVTKTLEGINHTKRYYCSEFGFRDDYTGSRQMTVDKMKACFDFFRSDTRYAQAHWFCLKDFPGAYYGLYEDGGLGLSFRKALTWCAFRGAALGSYPTGVDRIVNGSFETGSLNPWVAYGRTDGAQTGAQFHVGPYEGARYFLAAGNYDKKNGGIYQVVNVAPGRLLQARAYVNTYREGGDEKSCAGRIGIDPSGGVDPASPKIIWSRWLESPECHAPLDVKAIATSGQATLFLEHFQDAEVWNVTAFDKASLIESDTLQPSASSNFRFF